LKVLCLSCPSQWPGQKRNHFKERSFRAWSLKDGVAAAWFRVLYQMGYKSDRTSRRIASRRDLHRTAERIMPVLVASAAARISEGLARDGNELPAVAPVRQGQLQDTEEVRRLDFAVRDRGPERIDGRSAG